jgi:hypothetical protein
VPALLPADAWLGLRPNLTPEPSPFAYLSGSTEDQMPLELGKATKHRHHQLAVRSTGVANHHPMT